MGNESDILRTIGRLLGVKKGRGFSANLPVVSKHQEIEPGGEIVCVGCGYSQDGQRIDRCPECGLLMASRLRDPTAWSATGPGAIGWWATAWRIWVWHRRTRIRTSWVPITAKSQSFAQWSIIASAVILGLALAVFNWNVKLPRLLAAVYFIVESIIGAVLAGALLAGGVWVLTVTVRGTWRRTLRFVPSCIHYGTAWWPPLSLLALLAACLYWAPKTDESSVVLDLLLVMPLLTWGLWLWGSITEAGYFKHVGARLMVVVLCLAALGSGLVLLVPGSSRLVMVQLLDRTGSGLLKVNLFGTYSANSLKAGSQSYALIIDAIPNSGDEQIIEQAIDKLGAEDRVRIDGRHCTLEQIEKAFAVAGQDVHPEDKFILYINGHGAQNGSGAIAMANGFLTSQKLSELLSKMPTSRCLVVIDSCFGGKFIPALKENPNCNAVVITTTDNRNLAYYSGFGRFWKALVQAKPGSPGQTRVTVQEAFWSSYTGMLADGEDARSRNLKRAQSPPEWTMFVKEGYATPQLDIIGKARAEDFAVPVSTNKRVR